jgi:protein scribble
LNSDGEEDEVEDEPYDDRAWQERENSRTHSVKFTDAAEHKADDRDVSYIKCYVWTSMVTNVKKLQQTPFVRQNTPHPRELKAKAHKLFGKGKDGRTSLDSNAAQDYIGVSYIIPL